MIGGFRPPDCPSIYEYVGMCTHGVNWRAVVLGAAQVADDRSPELPAIAELRAAVGPHDNTTGDLEGAVDDVVTDLFDRAVLLGYALARTWPASAEGFDDWPRRALEYAGLGAAPPTPQDPNGVAATREGPDR